MIGKLRNQNGKDWYSYHQMSDKKFYVTTSIPYANAGPHVGHILDPLIADVVARHRRLLGDEVRFLAGTDEHGAKIVRTAEAAEKTPQELVNENSEKFRGLKLTLNLSYDDFIRTSDKSRHWPGAQKMWRLLVAAGDIYKKNYRGLYCVGHEAFVTEKDLISGKCPDHQKEPEIIEEENWFFRLSKYSNEIRTKIESNEFKILPESRRNEILSLLKSGLEDVSFSRPAKDLSWGVPVPDDPSQTMYVWCDALVNYISAVGYGQDDAESQKMFAKWWPADLQVIGKDNLRFHAAIWPGMLLSAGLPLPRALFVHGFINVDGQKISKTIGNVIPPDDLVSKYGTDAVRYYFLREFPSHEDGDFSYKKFEERYNGDLANGLGNLVARVVTLAEKFTPISYGDHTPTPSGYRNIEFDEKLKDFKFNEALELIWRQIAQSDAALSVERPWYLEGQERLDKVMSRCIEIVIIADLLELLLPETSEKIREQISFDEKEKVFHIKKGPNLFPRLK